MITVSDVTGERYEPENSVYFKNAKQSASYVLWGAKLLDVFPTSDKVFVFVFSNSDHEKFKIKWIFKKRWEAIFGVTNRSELDSN